MFSQQVALVQKDYAGTFVKRYAEYKDVFYGVCPHFEPTCLFKEITISTETYSDFLDIRDAAETLLEDMIDEKCYQTTYKGKLVTLEVEDGIDFTDYVVFSITDGYLNPKKYILRLEQKLNAIKEMVLWKRS